MVIKMTQFPEIRKLTSKKHNKPSKLQKKKNFITTGSKMLAEEIKILPKTVLNQTKFTPKSNLSTDNNLPLANKLTVHQCFYFLTKTPQDCPTSSKNSL